MVRKFTADWMAKDNPRTASTAAGISGHFILSGVRVSAAKVAANPKNSTAATGVPSSAGGKATTRARVSRTPQGISAHQLARSRRYTAAKPAEMKRKNSEPGQSPATPGHSCVVATTAASPRRTKPGMAAHQLARLLENTARKAAPEAPKMKGHTSSAVSRMRRASNNKRIPASRRTTPAMMLAVVAFMTMLPGLGARGVPR
ncbi:hypothetical protein D9M72_445960 [compost metagenome]